MPKPSNLGELVRSGWRSRTIKAEIRDNLIQAIRDRRPLFPGIVGYGETVVPAVVNALLAGHDLLLIGLRGQAKTRMLRGLSQFLDDEIPVIAGTPLNDDPLAPASAEGRRLAREAGDDLPIEWLPREARYQEKLATPDVTMADLIGDIDPVRAASRGESILDEEAVAYGIIPRTNRGIFAVNELPDLAPRIQVALLNVMEERDIQVRGFPIRIPLDLMLCFSANPEDYTRRGNLITPLRDRIAAQIHTHYPQALEDGLTITRQESWVDRGGPKVYIPRLAEELVEEVVRAARESDWVDQASGVSARLTIALLESVVSNAERRALEFDRPEEWIRISDFFSSISAITGKIELVFEGEREGPEQVATHLIGAAVKTIFDRNFPDFFDEDQTAYDGLTTFFREGGEVHTDDCSDGEALCERMSGIKGFTDLVSEQLPTLEAGAEPLGFELILEGLHQHSILAKHSQRGRASFTDMVSGMWESLDGPGAGH